VLICSLEGFASWHDGPASRLQRPKERTVGPGRPRTLLAGGCGQLVMPTACCLLFSFCCLLYVPSSSMPAGCFLNGVSLVMLCASVASCQLHRHCEGIAFLADQKTSPRNTEIDKPFFAWNRQVSHQQCSTARSISVQELQAPSLSAALPHVLHQHHSSSQLVLRSHCGRNVECEGCSCEPVA